MCICCVPYKSIALSIGWHFKNTIVVRIDASLCHSGDILSSNCRPHISRVPSPRNARLHYYFCKYLPRLHNTDGGSLSNASRARRAPCDSFATRSRDVDAFVEVPRTGDMQQFVSTYAEARVLMMNMHLCIAFVSVVFLKCRGRVASSSSSSHVTHIKRVANRRACRAQILKQLFCSNYVFGVIKSLVISGYKTFTSRPTMQQQLLNYPPESIAPLASARSDHVSDGVHIGTNMCRRQTCSQHINVTFIYTHRNARRATHKRFYLFCTINIRKINRHHFA